MLQKESETLIPDSRWKDLYRLGGFSGLVIAVSVLLAIAAFFIWPYKDSFTSMDNIFSTLQADRLVGLISLDLSMLLIAPVNILMFLALYVALKQVNESYALVALVVALIAVVLVIQARPLAELMSLSNKYAEAASEIERNQTLAAGESLRSYLEGTAWIMQTIFFMVAGLINSLLMLRTRFFSKAAAWTGIIISVVGMGFFLPTIGLLFLFVNTIGSVPWCLFVARDFFKLERQLKG